MFFVPAIITQNPRKNITVFMIIDTPAAMFIFRLIRMSFFARVRLAQIWISGVVSSAGKGGVSEGNENIVSSIFKRGALYEGIMS